MDQLSKHIVQVINERRECYGINIAELAKRLNMAPAALRAVMRGDRNLLADEFVLLCSYFHLDIASFYPVRINQRSNVPPGDKAVKGESRTD